MRDLKFGARRCTSVPYDIPPPGTALQLQRLAEEGRPGAWAAVSKTPAPPTAVLCCTP